MISITDKSKCCGCNACVQACPKQCIEMHEDDEGFLYPRVNTTRCIDCGKCEKVCPVFNQAESHRPINVYAAINPNEEIRRQSSSGGIFTLLAEQTIKDGGVVFGVLFDESWQVIHDYTESIEGLAPFRGSKYVQSRIGDTFQQAEAFLKQGRKVLFTGTPCQIAGLKRYLRKEYENLLTVDFVCHGVPSPLIWQKYLSETLDNFRAKRGAGKKSVPLSIDELPVITGISFRDKANGWKKYGFRINYAASKAAQNTVSESTIEETLLQPFPDNLFMKGFLSNIYLRPACYACPAKSGKSGADITIGDFWGIDHINPSIDDDKGCSLVIPQSPKGVIICAQVEYLSVLEYLDALKYNPSIEYAVKSPINRSFFFWNINKGKSVSYAYEQTQGSSILKRIQRALFRKLHK